jgi:hypothetical protein
MSGISPQQNKDPQKKRGARIEKQKSETSSERLHVSKKKGSGWDLHVAGRDSIKRKKG